ncbi:two-component system, OmpR family, sensor histidine kinase BaeS [Alicyclobacillus macrosporangiidus]|uniref:histidine kinase n=1 Tax=Alicyclobacillus macrosporangiidus TaxID=392015 RepID=A0A1I7F663_9BACL|nr:ATP-binding protein [Alicyclobacillus macrosporangiidus]SFU31605.1 two-component system, OmpR family, sensor histidine kinase BaeS [Alicyclobacillus macrosporangiidus]
MNVRKKVFLAIASLVILTSLAFFTLSQGYLSNLFRQYSAAAAESDAEQWAEMLEYYYQTHHNSWWGVDQYIATILGEHAITAGDVVYIIIYDQHGVPVVQVGRNRRSRTDTPLSVTTQSGMVTVPLDVNGHPIGSLQIWDRAIEQLHRLEQTVLHTAMVAAMWSTVITAAVGVMMGAWFARWTTKPLHNIIRGLRRLKEGDLETRLPASSADEFGEVARTFNEMTDRLSKAEQARKHLVADVAHELRMPLTIIQGQLELIQQGVKQARPETLLPIYDEVVRLSRLVEDLHQLSLAEVGKLSLVLQTVDPVDLIEGIANHFDMEFEERGIRFSLLKDVSDGVRIRVDPDRITQVVVNLLGNAIRYTPSGGTVSLRLYDSSTEFCLELADSGPGISAAHLPHVFDRFYRADDDRSRETGGTGLGLAIAKEFVEAHGGRISAESEPGKGSVFKVCLPVVDTAENPGTRSPS